MEVSVEASECQWSQSFLSKELYIGLIPSFLPLYELANPINAIENMTNRVSNPLISGINLRLTPAFHNDWIAFGIRNNPISLYLCIDSTHTKHIPKI
jgi:hypothetical protein